MIFQATYNFNFEETIHFQSWVASWASTSLPNSFIENKEARGIKLLIHVYNFTERARVSSN